MQSKNVFWRPFCNTSAVSRKFPMQLRDGLHGNMITGRNYLAHKLSSRPIKPRVLSNEPKGLGLARKNVTLPRPDAEISAREQIHRSGKFETSTSLEKK